jgi:hypothetical protein
MMRKATPKMVDPAPASSNGHCLPRIVRRGTGDDDLRGAREQRPRAEDGEDVTLVASCRNAECHRRHDADQGVHLQKLPSRALLSARVDYRGDRVDQRIEHEQDPDARRQVVGRHRENRSPGVARRQR